MKIKLSAVLTAVGAIVATSAVLADETIDVTEDAQSVTASQSSTSASLRAVRDKKTGKLRAPNANEIRDMEEAEKAKNNASKETSTAAATETVVVHHADGMLSAKLGQEHLVSIEGERNADGAIEKSHLGDEKNADTKDNTVVSDILPTE
jgi:hypothetical protein